MACSHTFDVIHEVHDQPIALSLKSYAGAAVGLVDSLYPKLSSSVPTRMPQVVGEVKQIFGITGILGLSIQAIMMLALWQGG